MRRAALLTALLTLSGCATLRQALPSLVRPAPAAAASPGPAAPSGGPVTTPPAAPASAPVPAPSGSAPSPAAPAPTAAPAPPLTASLSPVETRRLQEDAHRRIDDAARLLRQLEGRPFAPKDLETLSLAHSLVEQARKALGSEEYERAANLAVKARTLAEDLSTRR